MRTIIVNSHKGGSGKSTLCRVLAVEAAINGSSVFVIDLDSEGQTLTRWHEARTVDEPQRVETSLEAIGPTLKLLSDRGVDYVFIDTPPNAKNDMPGLFQYADLVLIPVKASSDDLKSAAITVAALKAQNRPFLFVITMAVKNANITAQAIAALSHHGPVAEVLLANRVQFPEAFTDGRSPQEVNPKSLASEECAGLWKHIQTCLHASVQATNHVHTTKEEVIING